MEIIQANRMNQVESEKAASLRNVRQTLLQLLRPSARKTSVLNVLRGVDASREARADLKLTKDHLTSFERQYEGTLSA